MWLESLYDSVWVNMKHITHFKIEEMMSPCVEAIILFMHI